MVKMKPVNIIITGINTGSKLSKHLVSLVINLMIRFLLSLAFIFSTSAYALNWETGYGAKLTAGYDDNFRLSSTSEVDTSFNKLSLFVSREARTEISSVQVLAGVNTDSYSDSSVDGRTTGNLSLSLNRQGERAQTGLDVSYLTEPTLESELLDTGILVDGARNTLKLSTGMSYSLDERNSVSLNLGFSNVSFDTVSLVEYQDNSLSLEWSYRLDETSDFSTSLRSSQYEPDNVDSTDTNSLNLGYTMRPTETSTYRFSVGYSEVDGPTNAQTGGNYSLVINNKPDELNSFSLTAAHSFQASGLGVVREQDRLGLNWVHAFTEKVQGLLSVDFSGTDARDYFAVQPGISYRLSNYLSIAGNYRFRREETSTAEAESSSLLFTLSYRN